MPIQTSTPVFPTRVGSYLRFDYAGESVHAYLPPPLPPDPPLDLSGQYLLLEQTSQALGRLDGIAALLPDLAIFLYTYVRKEAVLSSQIEGTQSSLSDLLTHESSELPGVPLSDVQEVSNYVRAMYHGVERAAGWLSALTSFAQRDPRCSVAGRSGHREGARRVPALAKLDRRHTAG